MPLQLTDPALVLARIYSLILQAARQRKRQLVSAPGPSEQDEMSGQSGESIRSSKNSLDQEEEKNDSKKKQTPRIDG